MYTHMIICTAYYIYIYHPPPAVLLGSIAPLAPCAPQQKDASLTWLCPPHPHPHPHHHHHPSISSFFGCFLFQCSNVRMFECLHVCMFGSFNFSMFEWSTSLRPLPSPPSPPNCCLYLLTMCTRLARGSAARIGLGAASPGWKLPQP